MSTPLEGQHEDLVSKALEARTEAAGLKVSAKFLDTLKYSSNPKDKALFANLLSFYELISDTGGYEVALKPGSNLDAQLNAYEEAFIKKEVAQQIGLVPYKVEITPQETRISFATSVKTYKYSEYP
jgi:hypothetical protein